MQKNSDEKLQLNKTTISNLDTTSPPSTPENTPDNDVIKQPDTAFTKPVPAPAPENPEKPQ